jgi:hypothetical protein
MFKFFSSKTVTKKVSTSTQKSDLPPKGNIRIKVNGKVVYEGESGSVDVENKTSSFSSVTINGVTNVSQGAFVLIEGNVEGNVTAPMGVECGDVKGNVDSGMSVTCGNVGGDVDAGMSVTCGTISGNVDAGMSVTGRKAK